jgi:hypothetical protein
MLRLNKVTSGRVSSYWVYILYTLSVYGRDSVSCGKVYQSGTGELIFIKLQIVNLSLKKDNF